MSENKITIYPSKSNNILFSTSQQNYSTSKIVFGTRPHHKNLIKSSSTTIHELHEVIRKEQKTTAKFSSHYVSEHLRHM